jgi:hypothetical protein
MSETETGLNIFLSLSVIWLTVNNVVVEGEAASLTVSVLYDDA